MTYRAKKDIKKMSIDFGNSSYPLCWHWFGLARLNYHYVTLWWRKEKKKWLQHAFDLNSLREVFIFRRIIFLAYLPKYKKDIFVDVYLRFWRWKDSSLIFINHWVFYFKKRPYFNLLKINIIQNFVVLYSYLKREIIYFLCKRRMRLVMEKKFQFHVKSFQKMKFRN